jgi:membrane protein YqaA with SNARE-associated domain
VVLVVALVAAGIYFRDRFDLGAFAGYGLTGVFLLSMIASSILSLTFIPIAYYVPVFVLSSTLAGDWGGAAPLIVGTVSSLGAIIGQSATFLLGSSGAPLARGLGGRTGRRFQQGIEAVQRRGAWAVFALSALPNPLHPAFTLSLACMRYPPVKWFFFTFLGDWVRHCAIAYAGYFTLGGF